MAEGMSVYTIPRVLDPFKQVTTTELCEYRKDTCENCKKNVWGNGGPEKNHCILPDRKRHKPYCDMAINLELVCAYCHRMEFVHTFQHRVEFKRKQESRYGAERVEGWLAQVGTFDEIILA